MTLGTDAGIDLGGSGADWGITGAGEGFGGSEADFGGSAGVLEKEAAGSTFLTNLFTTFTTFL